MKKIKAGLVGLGGLGKVHGYNIAHEIPNAELVAACSVIVEELNYAKEVLGVRETFIDYDEMIKQADIEAVIIVSPNKYHASQIETAILAGKHVFSEKPLGVSIEECKRVETVIEKSKKQVFTIGFMRRFDKSYAYSKRRIEAGDIGMPYLIKATTIDPQNNIKSCIRYARNYPGMLFVGLGVHDIDIMHWLMGCRATTAYAMCGSYANREFDEFNEPEMGCALYSFENGGIGVQHVGRAAPHGYHVETEVIGTEGAIRISPIPQKNLAILYSTTGVLIDCVQNYTERFGEAYKAEMVDFFDCITKQREPDITVYDGTIAVQMGVAVTESYRKKEIITIKY